MKKRITALMLALGLAFSVCACSSGSSTAASTPASAPTSEPASEPASESAAESESTAGGFELKKVGWSTDIVSSNFTSGIAKAFQEQCDALGIEFEVQSADRDMNTQINQVENMIASGCQIIFLKPYDTSACEPISAACKEAGVPLVVIIGQIAADFDSAVIVNNSTIGEMKAQAIVDKLGGEGKVGFIHGTLSQAAWAEQADAAKALFAKYPGIEIVAEDVAENNDQANAIAVAENWIAGNVELDAVWCSQDTVAMGAGTSFAEAGKDVYVVGQGGEADAQQALKDGIIDATLYLPGKTYVTFAMQVAQAIAAGEPYEHITYVDLPLMTVDNIDELVS